MLKTLFLIALLLSTFQSLFGQDDDFREGFIIKNGHEFVYGYVKKENPEKYHSFTFKENKTDPPVAFTANQISGYGFLNENHFISKEIENENGQREKVFLEAVTEGRIILYSGLNRIFIERDQSFYELKSDPNKISSYRSIIASFVSDCKYATKKVNTTQIELNQLIDLIKIYETCFSDMVSSSNNKNNSSARTERKHYETKVNFEFFAGVDRTQFSIANASASFLNFKKFKDKTLVNAGVNFIISSSAIKHISFASGIWAADQRFYLIDREASSTNTSLYTAHVNYKVIRIPLMLRFDSLVRTKLQPYVKAGVTIPIILQSDAHWNQEVNTNNSVYLDNSTLTAKIKEPFQIHLMVGILFPISKKIQGFSEAWISGGKSSFKEASPFNGTPKSNFNSMGLNFGIRINRYAE